MNVQIDTHTREEVERLISQEIIPTIPEADRYLFQRAVDESTMLCAGVYKGQLKAVWGLVPPVMVSQEAYLWLQIVGAIDDCEFIFVRHSQRAMEQILKRYPTIFGHCFRNDKKAQRWLAWLGAKFDTPIDNYVPFTIKAKHEPAIAC